MLPGCSIVIVAYNSRDFLPACLRSVTEALQGLDGQVIVLDNGSPEPLLDSDKANFPDVEWIDSKENLGFGKGCNLAVKSATKPYLFFINPDTIVSKDAFKKILSFMEEHPESGTVGCRILNEDGSLQWACRRTFPSPLSAIFKTIGLARLFPKSKTFASYNMMYLDPDETAEVDAISGSFFCIRHDLYDQLEGFDKDYFMYGEDLDLCLRVQQAGFHNYYTPVANILHFKGQSCKTRRLKSYIDFYQAMLIFCKKHRRFHLPYFIVALGIIFAACIGVFSRLIPQAWKALPDALFLFLTPILFSVAILAEDQSFAPLAIIAGVQLLSLLLAGEYAVKELSLGKRILPLLVATVAASAVAVGLNFMFAPVVFSFAISLALLFAWRRFAFWVNYFYRIFAKKRHRAIILGGGEDSLGDWFDRYRLISGVEILGCVMNEPGCVTDENRKHLMGNVASMADICRRTGCREIWVQSNESGSHESYDVEALVNLGLRVYLLIGGVRRDFALVNLQFLK